MDISILITGGVGLLTSIISSWTTWFLARRKYNSEVDLNLVEKMEKSLEFYKSLSDDNKNRLEEITERNNELEKEVQELRKQVLNLTMNICMDLTCSHRIRETIRKYGKNKDRFDETSNSSRG
jgi:hypothetical protein